MKLKDPRPVHIIMYSSHNSLQVLCDESWTTLKWGKPEEQNTDNPKVWVTDDDRLYTFEEKNVSCKDCLAKMGRDASAG